MKVEIKRFDFRLRPVSLSLRSFQTLKHRRQVNKMEKAEGFSSSRSSSSSSSSFRPSGSRDVRLNPNSAPVGSADSCLSPGPGCQDSRLSGQSQPTVQTATQSSKLEKDRSEECHVQGCTNINISPSRNCGRVRGFNYNGHRDRNPEDGDIEDGDMEDEDLEDGDMEDEDIEDGHIVETLLVPVYIKHDNSPTSLRSDSDSGIGLQTPKVMSPKGSCSQGFSKGESDNTDASEFSDEDLGRRETSWRPKSPFERQIWNRHNGRFKVKKALVDCTSRPLSPAQLRRDVSHFSPQNSSRCSSSTSLRQSRRELPEPSPVHLSPASTPVNPPSPSPRSCRVVSPEINQIPRDTEPLSPEPYRRTTYRPADSREVPEPSSPRGTSGYTGRQYDLKVEIARMRLEVASMREEADILYEDGERTEEETDGEVEEESFQESAEEVSSSFEVSNTDAGDWEYSSDDNET